jgi:hypothetical protein
MDDFDSLEYSSEAKVNLPLLLSSVKKNVFFFEDNNKYNFYEILIEKIFTPLVSKNIHIETCNGKPSVINLYKEFIRSKQELKCFFILDADFDFIHGSNIKDKTGLLIYLDRYNIENYIVDESSLLSFLRFRIPQKKEDIISILRFDDWYEQIILDLFELFVLFIIIQQKTNPVEPNVDNGNSCERFLLPSGLINKGEIERLKEKLNKKIPNLNNEIIRVKERIEKIYGENKYKCICGKFLIHAAYRYSLKKAPGKIRLEDFKYILLESFNVDNLNFLRENVEFILNEKFVSDNQTA